MSIEAAKSFIDRMKTDDEFSKKVTACKDAEKRMAFVQQQGFNCTPTEIKQVGQELSEEELENVAGGLSPVCFILGLGLCGA